MEGERVRRELILFFLIEERAHDIIDLGIIRVVAGVW